MARRVVSESPTTRDLNPVRSKYSDALKNDVGMMVRSMKNTQVARLLAFVTGLVNQQLLLQNEYLVAENRILRAHLPHRLRLN